MALENGHDEALSAHQGPRTRARPRGRKFLRVLSWVFGLPIVILLVLWLILLVTPIPLPFVGSQARLAVMSSLPNSMDVNFGDTYLALEGGVAPVLQFSPVSMVDRASNAHVEVEALEIGFSPLRAVLGQPGVVITMVEPHLQVIQDLLGPRLGRYEVVEDPQGGVPQVRVMAGETEMPNIGIVSQGLEVRGGLGSSVVEFRSDNDWLIYNMASAEEGLRQLVENVESGLFSRFIVRNGTVDMHDVVYGVVRTFSSMNLDIGPDPVTNDVKGTFSTVIAGQRLDGTVHRFVDDEGTIHMASTIDNMDFSAVAPMMDDSEAMVAIKGTGDLISDIQFGPGEPVEVLGGQFSMDLSGTNLRMRDDFFPVSEAQFDIAWDAAAARFDLLEGRFAAGNSSANLTGTFVLGLDPLFGPTVRMSMRATDAIIQPNDLGPPEAPVDEIYFDGWSSPLYSAIGIDQFKAQRGDMAIDISGRLDMLRDQMGIDMTIDMQGATADDLKRFWPYLANTEARDWFASNIAGGRVTEGTIVMHSPLSAAGEPGEEMRLPETDLRLAIEAEDVEIIPVGGMSPILARGISRFSIMDGDMRVAFGDGGVETQAGVLNVIGATLGYADNGEEAPSVFEINGQVAGPIGAVLEIVDQVAPDALAGAELPFAPTSLSGDLNTQVSVRTELSGENGEDMQSTYSLTGGVANFASAEPIEGRTLSNGNLSINVNNEGYEITGPAQIDGLDTDLRVAGVLAEDSAPEISISSTFSAEDLAEFGFDASDVLGGTIGFEATVLQDGGLGIEVDLEDARLNIADLGITKQAGTPGEVSAVARFDEQVINVSDIDLGFGSVSLQGDLVFDQEEGLKSAEFSQFAISEGDSAELTLTPSSNGFALRLRGEQLDLKPLLRRFFNLSGGGTGGPQATVVDQSISLDAQLDRALGFYSVTAFNLNAALELAGSDLRNLALQANFGAGSSVSVTTNPVDTGRVMSVAFNDLGTLLRFANVYPQLAGGSGSMTLNTNSTTRVDRGQLSINNFAIIDEANVAQILGNHSDSRQLISRSNRLDFDSGTASFVRSPDRIEITEAVLDGDTMGGTAHGFIYTDAGQYDLAGTYIPLFGLNNAFQQIPLFGPLLGGRDGEGLIGVTFAIRGPLDDPQFLVNPASVLLPGVFRSLMEFRTRNRPQGDGGG